MEKEHVNGIRKSRFPGGPQGEEGAIEQNIEFLSLKTTQLLNELGANAFKA